MAEKILAYRAKDGTIFTNPNEADTHDRMRFLGDEIDKLQDYFPIHLNRDDVEKVIYQWELAKARKLPIPPEYND